MFPRSSERGSRWTHEDFQALLRKITRKISSIASEDSTQRIFCIEEEEVEDDIPGFRDEEGDEIVALGAQDDEVRFQEDRAVFEKMHNSVVFHLTRGG